MLRVRRRSTTRNLSLLLVAALSGLWIVAPSPADARSITQTQKAMADLSAALARQEQRSEISANEYDADEATLASINGNITTLDANIATLKVKEAKKRAQVAVTKKKVVVAVVRAFVLGASESQVISLFNQNVNRSDAEKIYQDQVIGNLDALESKLQREKSSLEHTVSKVAAQRARVASQRAKAQQQTDTMQALLKANVALENQTSTELANVTAQYRVQIINYEIQVGVEAAKDKNTAGEEQAVTAASAVGGQNAANQVIQAEQQAASTTTIAEVAGTAQGLAAVKAAESQIGVPYVWGGETPGVGFDCSGLVQWAWAKAGISIPRTTETQYPALLHVVPTDLQPGDLLFYFNLDGDNEVDHVVMYVGSGPFGVDTTIAAPYTGTDVEFAPFFSAGFIGAARP
ncbi:MAG: NlpC/P60 family protein [Acidimicrobiales bacterium]